MLIFKAVAGLLLQNSTRRRFVRILFWGRGLAWVQSRPSVQHIAAVCIRVDAENQRIAVCRRVASEIDKKQAKGEPKEKNQHISWRPTPQPWPQNTATAAGKRGGGMSILV